MCDNGTISPVCIGDLKAAELPTALEKFASTDFQGVVCLAIPYATFTDKVRLYRVCFCHTPAGFDDKGRLHPKTAVAIAHVVLKPSTSCKLKACAEGLVFSPTWHCGYSEELQSCFTERKLLPELVPVLQQLELATTIEVKRKLCESLGILNLERDVSDKVCSSCETCYIETIFYLSKYLSVVKQILLRSIYIIYIVYIFCT